MILIFVGLILLVLGIVSSKESSPLAKYRTILTSTALIIILIGAGSSMVKFIETGHVGVQKIYGKVEDRVLYEGLQIVNPFADIREISIQTQNFTMSKANVENKRRGDDAVKVLTQDGLELTFDVTVLYSVSSAKASKILYVLGTDYEQNILKPNINTILERSASAFKALEIVSEKRAEFEHNVRVALKYEFEKNGINFEQFLLQKIYLPDAVRLSIEQKITADQDAQRMKYILEKEESEAERKRVEARGIADAQKIISEGLSAKLLQFEQIKVQKELVNSPNSKIIILGESKNPLFFGDK